MMILNISNIENFIRLGNGAENNDSRYSKKDIDAIFLGDITNIAVNIYNEEGLDKESLLKYFFQIEYLYENDEISYKTLDDLIKLGFNRYLKSSEFNYKYQELTKSKSIKRQATKEVMQAIGRMCRTYVKNHNIYIYTVEELASKVDTNCLKEKILSPEMKAFVNIVNEIGYKYNEDEARLSSIFKYKGLKEYFICNGYATTFVKDRYILSPVLFNNIYKGALGEVAGKYILEKELNIKLNEIEEADYYEFFDFKISEGVYIDFKHWKQSYRQEKNRDDYKLEIENKLTEINGRRVYIINIIADNIYSEHKQNDGMIIEIPSLINNDGTPNVKALELLKGEVIGDYK